MPLQEVYDYFRQYDKSVYQVVSCIENEPSEEDIAAFEKAVGRKLPPEFREFTLSPLGGLYMDVLEELWPPAQPYDVGPFWSFCRGILVYGVSEEIPDFLDLRVRTREIHEMGYPDLLPFLSIIGNGDEIFCFDPDGNIVLLNYYETGEAVPVEGTFSECLMNQIRELEERKNRKLRGEDRLQEPIE